MRIFKNVISDTIRDRSRTAPTPHHGGAYATTLFVRFLAFVFLTTSHFLLPTSRLSAAVWYQSSYNDFNAGVFNYTTIKDTDTAASVELATSGPQELSTTVVGSTVVALYRFNNPPAELSADANTVGLWRMNEASWSSDDINDTPASGMLSQSGLPGFDAVKCVDGVAPDTAWHTDSAAAGAWLKMDLGVGNEKAYVKARIHSTGVYNGNYSVQYSPDGSSWYNAATNFMPNGSAWHDKTWASVGAYRYWRFYLTNTPGSGAWLSELEMYRGSTTVMDASGMDNHGMARNGANTVAGGMFGRCGSFDGVNDYVSCGNVYNFDGSDFSIELWVKPASIITSYYVLAKSENKTTNQQLQLLLNVGGNRNVTLSFWGDDLITTPSWEANTWNHFTATYKASTKEQRIYWNGKFVNSRIAAAQLSNTNGRSLTLGKKANGAEYFNGQMDEVRISNIARTAADICQSAGGAYDSSAFGNHGALNIATQTYTTSMSGFGNALQFNGVSDYANCGNPASLNITGNLSFGAWIKPSALPGEAPNDFMNVIGKYTSAENGYRFLLYNDGKILYQLRSGGATSSLWSSAAILVNTWANIVATTDGTTMKLYINGVLNNSQAAPASIGTTTDPFYVGKTENTYYFNGLIDEVRISSGALTAGQIALDAGGGYHSTGTYKSSVFDTGSDNVKVFYSSWSPTSQPGGTSISVAVRASNSSFAAGDASPAWTPATNGGNPDVTGRYIQWMSTFTTTNSTTTPRLEEITLTYIAAPSAPALNYITGDTFNQITWRWQDNSSGGSQEDGFKVYSSTGGILATRTADTTFWIETGLKRNKEYSRYVRAYNSAGEADSSTVTWRTKPGAFQSKVSQGQPTRTGPNAFGFVGDAVWEWDVPVKAGSALTITAYIRYNSDYGAAAKPKLTLSGRGIAPTSISATGAAQDAWELLTLNPGTPTENAILTLKAEGFSNSPGAKFYVDDISINQ